MTDQVPVKSRVSDSRIETSEQSSFNRITREKLHKDAYSDFRQEDRDSFVSKARNPFDKGSNRTSSPVESNLEKSNNPTKPDIDSPASGDKPEKDKEKDSVDGDKSGLAGLKLPPLRKGWGPYQALSKLRDQGKISMTDSEMANEARRIRDREFARSGKNYFHRGEQLEFYSQEELGKKTPDGEKTPSGDKDVKKKPEPKNDSDGDAVVPDDSTKRDLSENNNSAAVHRRFDRAAQESGRPFSLHNTREGVYLRSNFDVDVDGSPRARQIDRYGSTKTSWSYRNGKYINAEKVPYIVLPRGKYQQFGVKVGDYALVRDKETNKVAAAVFADVGPRNKTGEGSIYLANEKLGLNVTPNRGISGDRFEYLVFPGSSEGRPQNEAELLDRIAKFEKKMGIR